MITIQDKISIILPIFNVGSHLRGGIDSLINQTIGNENLEIIMVNDCSTDGSDEIINEYAEKYDCCKAIHLEKNTGAANGPRNKGLENCTGDYIMFLDPDDRYVLDACETLYNSVKEHDADIAFGRFRRIFTYGETVQKSYSPYEDDLENSYPDEILEDHNPLNVSDFIWTNALEKLLYGKDIVKTYERKGPVDKIVIKNIKEEPDLLKIPPSVWTKIYKRELIMDNNIKYQKFISGDDMAFTDETFLKASGIVFLNNYFCYDYFIRDLPEDKSITNNVNVRLLADLMDSYIYCAEISKPYGEEIANVAVNPHLMYWANTWKNASMTRDENKLLLEKLEKLRSIHNAGLKTKFLLSSLIKMLEAAILVKK
ncbi:glycosyltransferase family 2 protein [Methanobrevibacter sp. DSM 116169]|uniref:glycosyltransferase family 2 protein n=1 Tax=Methanobrevibacter sp. DSM 116169 TaxID=3242727 RepID=UPI0038FC6025